MFIIAEIHSIYCWCEFVTPICGLYYNFAQEALKYRARSLLVNKTDMRV